MTDDDTITTDPIIFTQVINPAFSTSDFAERNWGYSFMRPFRIDLNGTVDESHLEQMYRCVDAWMEERMGTEATDDRIRYGVTPDRWRWSTNGMFIYVRHQIDAVDFRLRWC